MPAALPGGGIDVEETLLLGEEALQLQDYSRAAELFERVIAADPTRERAHYNLALCREAMGEREGAIRAYDRLAQISDKPRWQRLARSRMEALKRKLGEAMLYRAECLADVHQWRLAMDTLGRMVDSQMPPMLDQKARGRYYQAMAGLIVESVASETASLDSTHVVMGDFKAITPEYEAEARDFRRIVRNALIEHPAVSLSQRSQGEGSDGDTGSDEWVAPSESWGYPYEPSLFCTFGPEISVRFIARAPARVLFHYTLARKGAVPPTPADGAWDLLPVSEPGRSQLEIDVWAERETATAGRLIRVECRPSRDSFVAVYRLGADGRFEQALPSGSGGMRFVRGGEVVSVSAPDHEGLAVDRPGVEGFWAVASSAELPLRNEGAAAAVAARRMRELLTRLPSDRWAAAAYKVRVRRAAEGEM